MFQHLNGGRSGFGLCRRVGALAILRVRWFSGTTGHAESVLVVGNDPSQISYDQLLQVFFIVAHDPTQRDRQSDVGPQYRSAIFYRNGAQRDAARRYIAKLEAARLYSAPVVTEVSPLGTFNRAEEYHQNYLAHHPDQPYIVINDAPKLAALRRQFPDLYRS